MKAPVEISSFQENLVSGNAENSTDFSEFLWMAEEELDDFDKRFYEELLIEECIQDYEDALLETMGSQDNNGCISLQLTSTHIVNDFMRNRAPQVYPTLTSKLNPNAAIFVPRQREPEFTNIQR